MNVYRDYRVPSGCDFREEVHFLPEPGGAHKPDRFLKSVILSCIEKHDIEQYC